MNVSHLPGGALARSVSGIQSRIAEARTEMVTGQVADPVATLGAGRGRTLALDAQADRLDRIREANTIVFGRLDATAAHLRRMDETTGQLVETFVGAMSGALDRGFLLESASAARAELRQSLNATHDGAYLFAGTTSDIAPIRDGADAALEARFVARFGFGSDDPAAGTIAPDAVADFARDAAQWLAGPSWNLVSEASPDPVLARIAPGESVAVSVSANENAARDAYAAAYVAEHLFASALDDQAANGVARGLLEQAAGAGFAQLEGRLGIVQARVARANERLTEDADGLRAVVAETLGVDPFEAAQRFQRSVTQLETAYALTGRLSQLTLMRFL